MNIAIHAAVRWTIRDRLMLLKSGSQAGVVKGSQAGVVKGSQAGVVKGSQAGVVNINHAFHLYYKCCMWIEFQSVST